MLPSRDIKPTVIQAVIAFAITIFLPVPFCIADEKVFPGADEKTPSRSQYFSWINNTNEGSTEAQTLTNLDFFKWLHDEYGMALDIYAFDAGNIDGKRFYGSMDSDRFKRQFPNGFDPIYEKAKSFGCRLGIWGGPDGFAQTPEQEQARIDMMVKLCKDYEFMLFKIDAVCGQLRDQKQDAFIRMMKQCRKYSPDLIVLNHRLNLGHALPYVTTWLFEGAETYIDVHMTNAQAATHNRVCALYRGLVPNLKRLIEDHGVCLSSCLDYWQDDLILQAFNRCLILAPQIYGNPWLLRDDELPKLARIYNLHRRYRDILVNGIVLPENDYGPFAVSRGNSNTRFITLRNLTWQPVRYLLTLGSPIGLTGTDNVELRQFHPTEKIIGLFTVGYRVKVEVPPFRSSLLMATNKLTNEVSLFGCDYQVVRDVPDKPAIVKLMGLPGTKTLVMLSDSTRKFTNATLDGEPLHGFVNGRPISIKFPGTPLKYPYHRKLGDLKPCHVPPDAEALYEVTCFAANNNALEVRSLTRSGPTKIPQVKKARDAFFNQPLFIERGIWDKYLFDDNPDTAFQVCRRWDSKYALRINGGSLRVDFGQDLNIDKLILRVGSEYYLQPLKTEEAVYADVSDDLINWQRISFWVDKDMVADIPADKLVRYLRVHGCPDRITEIEGYKNGIKLDRSNWRASNLFSPYWKAPAVEAWSLSFTLDEAPKESYLAIPIIGTHGYEAAYAAIRVDGKFVGAPRRAPSYPSNTWECPVRKTDSSYTYYVPVTKEMVGKKIDVFVLLLKGGSNDIKPEAWITAYHAPFETKQLVLIQ